MEDIIDTCPIVSHAVVIGDGKPFISALIELDSDMTRSWLSQQGLDADMSMKQVAENDAVRAFVQQYVEKANANVSRAESVRKFEILDEEFNQQDGTLTASLKVVRPKVLQRYADVIENVIYAPKPSNRPLPKTVQILDRTTETVKQASESMRQASESVSPKVGRHLIPCRRESRSSPMNRMTRRHRPSSLPQPRTTRSVNFGNP